MKKLINFGIVVLLAVMLVVWFMLPWYVSGGSSTIEYVPLTGSVTGSTNTPLMPTVFGP